MRGVQASSATACSEYWCDRNHDFFSSDYTLYDATTLFGPEAKAISGYLAYRSRYLSAD